MTNEERAQIDNLIEWLDNGADGTEDAGALAHDCTRWFPALVALKTAKEQAETQLAVAEAIDGTFWEALKRLKLKNINVTNPGQHVADVIDRAEQAEADLVTLREQLAQREDAAFRAGWLHHEGISIILGSCVEPDQLSKAFAAWRASQKGTP